MSNQPRIYTVIGNRPTQTPDGKPIPLQAVIYNAPRPLYGDPTWQGDFIHGIFYAIANDAREHKDNVSLDGWSIRWVTEQRAIQWARAYYRREYPAEAEGFLQDASRRDLLAAFMQHANKNE